MRARSLLIASLFGAVVTTACVLDQPEEELASSNQALSACVAAARPSTGFSTEPALGDLSFPNPVAMVPSPTDGSRLYVVEKKGAIRRVTVNGAVATKETLIDITSRVNSSPNEAGLLGFALHPKFTENGLAFFSYTKTSSTAPAGIASVIARGKSSDGGLTIDPSTLVELLVFDQPYSNHNGGHVAFGQDGFLYASFGDGGSGGDPQGNGQKTTTFLGKILRIDVDSGSPYAIPADNPFRAGGGKPEIYAYGLRNTWRFSFDRLTGDLWAGDVGQNKYEEVDRIVLGGNYGWGVREGLHCYGTNPNCNVPGAIDPVVEYDHGQGYSITGGYVYRGSLIPELYGQYIYGDFGSGNIWAIPTNVASPTPRLLFDSPFSISSFAQDRAGELYVLDYGSGKIKHIIQTSSSDGIPAKLSQTGCFLASDPKVPAPSLIAYDVNSPLWSDGAEKARWLALPQGGKITIGADGDWDLPVGTVTVKEFRLGGKRIETRLFMRHTDGSWAGYTYEWNDAETEATLLTDGKTKQVGSQTWTYPSRAQCQGCHSSATGGTIGLETAQLNRDHAYPDGTQNQLDKLAALGAFSAATPLPADRPALPSPSDAYASAEAKARSYLHSNCGFCHRPQGAGRGAADFRFSRTFAGTKVCNTTPEAGDLGIAGAKLLVPGDLEKSLLSVRMHRTGEGRMPPLASSVVDETGTAAVDAWISSVTACP